MRANMGQGSGGDDGASSKDNSEDLRRWIARAVNFEVPWLLPLAPWQPGAEAGTDAGQQHQQQVDEEEEEGEGADEPAEQSATELPAAPPPPPAPTAFPPPPLGAEALAQLATLNGQSSGSGPRHVCIRGRLESSRRNYTAAFEAIRCVAIAPLLLADCICDFAGAHQLAAFSWQGGCGCCCCV